MKKIKKQIKNKIWVMADLHLGHTNLAENKLRPWGYEIEIFANINTMCKLNDIFICLGDVSWYNHKEEHSFLTQLSELSNCHKWLVKGNHDNYSYYWCLNHGWDFVAESFTLKRYGYNIIFSHKPVPIPDDPNWLNIHGHFHNNPNRYLPEYKWLTNRHICINIEGKYKPYNLETIIKQYRKGKLKC